MLKACPYCGRMHDINTTCPRKPTTQKGRKYQHRTDADKLRNTYRWRQKREQIKQDAHWMCEVCADKGNINNKHLEVHHITKLNQAPDLLIDDNNLICLCVIHHKQADAGQLDPNYLHQLAHKRNQNT